MSDAVNRPTDSIQSQEEADGVREGLERRRQMPAHQLTPEMEEQMALDEVRLAEWDNHVDD